MDDGEVDFSNHDMFSTASITGFFDEIFNDSHACTHTHKCNPPDPDSSHTHTCYHVHTKILPALIAAESSAKKANKRNREAVKKYREEKKARTASLEDEVARLTTLNQQLIKTIQTQVGLESQVGRLKSLLVDIRGRIDGSFPYQNSAVDPCNRDFEGSMLNEFPGCGADHGLPIVNPSAGTKRKGKPVLSLNN